VSLDESCARSPRADGICSQHGEAIGERTATAMQHKPAQGEYTGGPPPYGRRVGADSERLEPDADEEAARAVARQLRAQGPFSAAGGG
jgi:DNA invertase Pin-like site-specific DNA recombinase